MLHSITVILNIIIFSQSSPSKQVGLARGNINPLTMEIMDTYSPSKVVIFVYKRVMYMSLYYNYVYYSLSPRPHLFRNLLISNHPLGLGQ